MSLLSNAALTSRVTSRNTDALGACRRSEMRLRKLRDNWGLESTRAIAVTVGRVQLKGREGVGDISSFGRRKRQGRRLTFWRLARGPQGGGEQTRTFKRIYNVRRAFTAASLRKAACFRFKASRSARSRKNAANPTLNA